MIPKNLPHFDELSDWNGFVAINSNQIIDHASHMAQELSAKPEIDLSSQLACDAFIELVGCEEALGEIIEGKLPYLEFNQINRPTPNGSVELFDFKLIPMDELSPQSGAILLIRPSQIQG